MTAARTKRIGIAVETSWWGGLESHAVDLAAVLAAEGHEVLVVCSNPHTSRLFAARSPFEVVTFPAFGGSSVVTLLRALRALGLDACVLEKGTLHAASVSFDLAARLACRRYITIQQLSPPPIPPPSRRRRFGVPSPSLWRHRMVWRGWLRSVFPHTTVCVSDAVAASLAGDYGFPAGKLLTVRNGVDVQRFVDDEAAARRLRAAWQVPDGTFLFGAVCRLVPEKGVDICLDAFREVVGTTPTPVRLVVVGDGPERAALESRAERLGLTGSVHFAGFHDNVPAILAAIDCLVLSSRMEGLPLTVAESLSVGRPVIASRVAGTPEIITSDEIGWLVTPGDVGELGRSMREAAIRTPERVACMQASARSHAVAHFNSRDAYRRIASLAVGP